MHRYLIYSYFGWMEYCGWVRERPLLFAQKFPKSSYKYLEWDEDKHHLFMENANKGGVSVGGGGGCWLLMTQPAERIYGSHASLCFELKVLTTVSFSSFSAVAAGCNQD